MLVLDLLRKILEITKATLITTRDILSMPKIQPQTIKIEQDSGYLYNKTWMWSLNLNVQ